MNFKTQIQNKKTNEPNSRKGGVEKSKMKNVLKKLVGQVEESRGGEAFQKLGGGISHEANGRHAVCCGKISA